jgi:hypothetical protein
MKKIFTLIIGMTILTTGIAEAVNTTGVTWYSGGESVLKFSSVPQKISWVLPFKGTSAWPVLLLNILNDKTGAKRTIKFYTGTNLDTRIIMRDGPGSYTVTVFGSRTDNNSFAGICDLKVTILSNVPRNINFDLNDKVLEYAEKTMGKTVGRGECWDLIQADLDSYGADWQRPTAFGTRLDPLKDAIKPGDIVQMYSLTIKYSNRTEYFGLPQHTAIIHKVTGKNRYELINQNVAGKRYVVLTDFRAGNVVSGRMEFYRPQAGMIK